MLKTSELIKFDNLVTMCAVNGRADSGIGTYSEKSLHYILKNLFEDNADYHEVAYKGYVADVMRGEQITEIQTATLYGMKDKLEAFLADKRVRIVFPLVKKKRIIWTDPLTGESEVGKRPVKGSTEYDLLAELLYISEYLRDPSLVITIVELEADDYRLLSKGGKNRKIGARKVDTVPTKLIDIKDMEFPRDFYPLVPKHLSELFTRDEFSKATKLKARKLWAALKILEEQRIIEKGEPDGRRYRYRRCFDINK